MEGYRANIGYRAPDFKLKNENGSQVSFHDWREDMQAVLVFIKAVDDRHTRELLIYLKDDAERIESREGRIIAVSYGNVRFNKRLVKELDLPFHILSDEGCDVIKTYGIFNEYDKLVGPAIFVINKGGIIRYIYTASNPEDVPEDTDILAALQGIVSPIMTEHV
ncbi:peroxiredoxin [Methanocella sp. CWC-04]|uniref:Peroxiredoxin n=2 Tax=Methanooceanicella nereidis TaxID=2052831 RepID=A0AAP2RA91_9EURY|nr:peroxiredoxin [Methanocella sp. CWC-04]